MNDFLIPIELSIENKEHVYVLQTALIVLGYGDQISVEEKNNRTFGPTTQNALVTFQQAYGITQTSGVSSDTINEMNELLAKRYRICGYVNDSYNLPIESINIEVVYRPYSGSEVILGTGISLSDGSYRVFLDIPSALLNENKELKDKICILVNCYQNDELKFTSDKIFISEKENIFTFVSDNFVFNGKSVYELNVDILTRNGININDLSTASKNTIKEISSYTGISIELLMKYILSMYLSNYTLYGYTITKEFAFGYLYQQYPKNMSLQLFNESIADDEWEDYKIQQRNIILAGLLLISTQDHLKILNDAVKLRYIPVYNAETIKNAIINLIRNKNSILNVLPLLEKNVSIEAIATNIKEDVAEYFMGEDIRRPYRSGYIQQGDEYTEGVTVHVVNDFNILFDGFIEWRDYTDLFGNYIDVNLHAPEDVPDLTMMKYAVRGQVKDYNSLSDNEKTGRYIHVRLDYTSQQKQFDSLLVEWTVERRETFYVHVSETTDMEPNPSEYKRGYIGLDPENKGGKDCECTIVNGNCIKISGSIDYSTNKSNVGNTIGVRLYMPEDLIELSGIRCRVRGKERNYTMLTHQEINGRYVQFFLDYTRELPQVDTFCIEWAEGRREVYSVVFSKGTILKPDPSMPEVMQGEILNFESGGCTPTLCSKNFIMYTGEMNWNSEFGGNCVGVNIRKPSDIEELNEVQFYVRGRIYNVKNLIFGDSINVYLNYEIGIPPIDMIIVQWRPERAESYYVELENITLQPNPEPMFGWIRRDWERTGGNECEVEVVEKQIIFRHQIQWSYHLGGNYVGVLIHAPENMPDINELEYVLRGQMFDSHTLTETEKSGRYIHLLLRYDMVNTSDTIIVKWNRHIPEEEIFVITIAEDSHLVQSGEWDYGMWAQKLAGLFVEHLSRFEAFIDDLAGRKNYLEPANIDKLKLCFQISRVVRNFIPMMEEVCESYFSVLITKGIRYIATYTLDSWKLLVNSVGFPDDFTDGDTYALLIYETAQKLYPEISCVTKLKTIPEYSEAANELEGKLLANPSFNLLTDRIEKLQIPLGDIKEKIQIIQNIYRITPNAEVTSKVLQEGVSNAEQVYRIGKKQLQERFKNTLSQKEIVSVFQSASARFSSAMVAYANISNSFNVANFASVESYNRDVIIDDLKFEFPDIETLFGNTDYCECPNDSSVYSAAAYLADILAYIDERKAKPNSANTVKHYLDLRRSDISNIYLNVQNTKTMMPYIDLVCEVLEESTLKVQSKNFQRTVEQCQSTLISQELCAAPEHLLTYNNTTAYDVLSESMYPMYAPLNLWEMEIRDYLKYIGVQRWDLMKKFQTEIDAIKSPLNVDIAAEFFCLTYKEQQIVVATNTYSIDERNAAWRQVLEPFTYTTMLLDDFTTDTGLSVYEVLDLVNDNREESPIEEKPIDPTKLRWTSLIWSTFTDKCTTDEQYINGSDLHYDRAHRFIRLWRKSGWKMWELDLLLRNNIVTGFVDFETDNLNETTLFKLMQFKQQQETLGLSVDALLAFYGNINILDLRENTKLQACLYDRVFLRKALSNPLNANLQSIKNGDTVTLSAEDKHLIAACLSVSDEDLNTLFTYYGLGSTCNISNVSFIYRQSIFMNKLKLNVKEFLLVLEFAGIDLKVSPYNYLYTVNAVDTIIKTVKDFKNSKLSITDLEYIVKYKDLTSTDISAEAKLLALSQEKLEEYTDGLKAIVSSSSYPRIPDESDIIPKETSYVASESYKKEFREKMLAIERFNNIDDIEDLIQIIECETTKQEEAIDDFTERLFPDICEVKLEGNLHIIPLEYKSDLINRYVCVIDYVVKTTSILLIENYISTKFVLSSVITEEYLIFKLPYENKTNLLNILLNKENYSGSAPLTSIHVVLNLINKMTLLLKRNNVTAEEFQLLLSIQEESKSLSTKYGIFTFNWFGFYTVDASLTPKVSYDDLIMIENMIYWQKKFGQTKDNKTLFSIILFHVNTSDQGNFFDDLGLLTKCGFDFMQIKEIFNWNMTSYYSPESFKHSFECIDMKSLVGLAINTINTWKLRNNYTEGSITITEKTRNAEIKDAVKAKYDINTWLEKLPEIQKPIREAKSNALAWFLIAYSMRPNVTFDVIWKDKEDLYAYFLLDTEMSACMQTSRIVQASCSVQLFLQRCFLNLESEIIVNDNYDAEWRQWEWMKKYRLWEANRKIFLYPENWIEPELRDDKTSLFKEMEDELNQGEITETNVENAFEKYLQKLHTLSHLEVCGIYQEMVDGNDGYEASDSLEQETSKVNITHVIARTKSAPFEHYYRKFDMLSGIWSEWEKVDLDIKDSVVVPVVYNRKLHLFWLNTVEKTYNNSSNNKSAAPYEYTEVQLMWSVLKNNKWTGAKASSKKHIQLNHNPITCYSIMIQYVNDSNELMINVYVSRNNEQEQPWCITYYMGVFCFDGDVYKIKSFLIDISSNHNLIKLWSLIGYTKTKFDCVTKKMDDIAKPEPYGIEIKLDASYFMPPCKMYSSRFYFYPDAMNVFDPSYNFYLNVLKNNANIVPMLHCEDPLYYGIYCNNLKYPFFYQDNERSFFVQSREVITPDIMYYAFEFLPFYHPYSGLFIKELNRNGVKALLYRNIQLQPDKYYPKNNYNFNNNYQPDYNAYVPDKYQKDIVDFDLSGSYSIYNWELFFHAPLYIACKLNQNQKFEEAMKWFHYIFNPTTKESGESPQKYWITKPFFELTTTENRKQQISNILSNIGSYAAEVNAWLNNPYKPHLIARTRLVAYQRTVVMKYIDNIIDWADYLFRLNTREYNNEATLLYILAKEILGKRPVMFPSKKLETNINYQSIKNASFSVNNWKLLPFDISINYAYDANLTVTSVVSPQICKTADFQQISNYNDVLQLADSGSPSGFSINNESLPTVTISASEQTKLKVQGHSVRTATLQVVSYESIPRIDANNFCLPPNDQLLSYWDIVEDRLFKLRNCLNIEGEANELALFEPPIDPALLVKAVAAGLSIGNILSEINIPQPYYRFKVLVQKAIEFTGEVKQLGDKLLSVIEKKDAETLNQLRATQEINLQQASLQIKKMQVEEAVKNLESINESIKIAQAKLDYYSSRELMNKLESDAYQLGDKSMTLNDIIVFGQKIAAGLSYIPTFHTGGAGAMGSPFVNASLGGSNFTTALNTTMSAISGEAQKLDKQASQLLTKASYVRRKEDWDFQANLAKKEIAQLNKQYIAAEIRLAIAEKERSNMEMQIEQSRSVLEYYENKYSNEELYNWMLTEISSIYFDAYKLAYDMAKKAEKCYCQELGILDESTVSFIQFGNWNSLRKGLLSGENLMHNLHQLESAYINNNKRMFELTKHISLAQMYPEKLLELISQTKTTLDMEEFIFDMDYPGHYLRRIKSVTVTIPNVAGPYTNVSFSLKLKGAKVRTNPLKAYEEESAFVAQTGGNQSICTSSAQNDAGMFELNFNDERYLPFENAGVISSWELSLPAGCNQFDLSSISDVILHINYTARYDGVLESKARMALAEKLPTAGRMFFSLKQDFPNAWAQMTTNMNFEIKTEHFPYFLRGSISDTLKVKGIYVMLASKENVSSGLSILLKDKEDTSVNITLQQIENTHGNIYYYEGKVGEIDLLAKGLWTATIGGFTLDQIEDVLCGFYLCN